MCGCIIKLIWRQKEMTNLCAKEIWLGAKAGGGGGGPTWSALIIELFKCRNFHRGSREGNNHNVELESRSDSSACCNHVEHRVSLTLNRRTSRTWKRWKTSSRWLKTLYDLWFKTLYLSSRWLKNTLFYDIYCEGLKNHNIGALRTWARFSSRFEIIQRLVKACNHLRAFWIWTLHA